MNQPAHLQLRTRPTRAGHLRHSKAQRTARLAHRDKYPVMVRSIYSVVPRNLIQDGRRVTHAQVQELVEILLMRKLLPEGGKILAFQAIDFGRTLQVSLSLPSHRPFLVPDWLTPDEPVKPTRCRI